ncbi:MAG: aminopeptidase P family protein [Bacteroidales bacterium]|nr:aminopeptidase P family protein [Bacteroidales bacterium]
MENHILQRIEALRSKMVSSGFDAVVVTGTDPHSSEYPAPRWQQVRWLTGFTGEAGDVVVTASHAGLWTDSRYFIQAAEQLSGTGVELHRTRQSDSVYIPEFLRREAANLGEDRSYVVAYDGLCMSAAAVDEIRQALLPLGEDKFELVSVDNLLSPLWTDRPAIPDEPIAVVPDDMTGESTAQKIDWLRSCITAAGADMMLLSSLDEIAWLLNVRGSDIEYNPLVISYLLVSETSVKWFVLKDRDRGRLAEVMASRGVETLPYGELELSLGETSGATLLVDKSTLSSSVDALLNRFCDDVKYATSPVQLRKAVKNPTEIASQRKAYIEDGLAVEKFLYWLECEAAENVTEWEASERLTALRAEIHGYRGNSFENISAYGKNAALPHYSTPREGSAQIERHGLYLVDSGGQYLTGTTDITRTVPMGECTPLEMEDYTLVLKGMIDLSMAQFPEGTAGCQIDAAARLPLWKAGRNFGHGTGHGIGFWLCVHEGPQSIRQNFLSQPLLPGMITSNEPGLYREGFHGIRHENVVLCREVQETEFGKFLGFETLTKCHIDTSAVIVEMLTDQERAWLNDYNAEVYETLSPSLDEDICAWLREKTRAI